MTVKKDHPRRIKALLIKEFYQIRRDPSSILITFIFPFIFLFLYGYGVSLDMSHLKLGIVMEDSSTLAQSFVRSFEDSPYFDPKIGRSREEAEKAITEGTIKGFIVIPSYFSAFAKDPSKVAPIQVIADGSEPNTAAFVQNYVQATFQKWLQILHTNGSLQTPPSKIVIQQRFWYNEELNSHYFLIPGSIAIILTLVGTLLTALVVAKEWERGTMEALLATPVTIQELVVAKVIPYFVLGLISFTLTFLASIFLLGVPLRGSFLVLLFVTAVFLIVALGVGLLISTISKNQFIASQLSIISGFLPAFILSGFVFEISSMPKIIQLITYILPAKYYVSSLQTIFLVGNVFKLISYNVISMAILGAILYTITAKKTVKSLE